MVYVDSVGCGDAEPLGDAFCSGRASKLVGQEQSVDQRDGGLGLDLSVIGVAVDELRCPGDPRGDQVVEQRRIRFAAGHGESVCLEGQ